MISLFKSKRKQNKSSSSAWPITDTILKASDIVTNVSPAKDLGLDLQGSFVCIRDLRSSCIYIKEDQFEKFKKFSFIYDSEKDLVNLTRLVKFEVEENCYSQVINKTNPPQVNIKELKVCHISGLEVYVTRVIRLHLTDQLFEDLMNLQMIKEKHKI